MGLKEEAMWKMAEKMGMPKSAIEAIKTKQKNGDKSAMPDMGKMMSMMQAMKGEKKDEMRKMAEKMGMPPQAADMDGKEIMQLVHQKPLHQRALRRDCGTRRFRCTRQP